MYHFIVNPYSKSQRGRVIWDKLLKRIEASGIEYKIYQTEHEGHAIELAKVAQDASTSPDDAIIVVGGDGSLNEVVSGLDLNYKPLLGYIPNGSGNDFARGLGYTDDPEKALDIILNSKNVKLLDCGEAIYGAEGPARKIRRFVVSSGIGYDAQVCVDLLKSKGKQFFNKFKLGKLSYFVVGFKDFFTLQQTTATVTIDDKEPKKIKHVCFISAHNLPFEGGGYPFAPNASAEDGELSVNIVAPKSKVAFFFAFVLNKTFVGIHTKFKGIKVLNCKRISIKIDPPKAGHTDGEVLGDISEIEYRVLPKAVRFLS